LQTSVHQASVNTDTRDHAEKLRNNISINTNSLLQTLTINVSHVILMSTNTLPNIAHVVCYSYHYFSHRVKHYELSIELQTLMLLFDCYCKS